MNRLYIFLIGLLAVLCACDPDALQEPNGPSIVNPDDILVGKNEVLKPDTQKQKLEQVATKMIDLFPADEYEDMMEMCAEAVGYGNTIFDEDYDFSQLEDAWEDIAEDFFTEEEISEYEYRIFLYLYFSNCTGTVEFGKNKATYTKSSDTKVIFHGKNGEKWEAEITPKGLKQVYLGEWMDTYGYHYDWETDKEYWYTDHYHVTVEIPSSLTASLKRNGETIAQVSFSIEHNIDKNGVNPKSDYVSFNCEIILDDLKYTAGSVMYNAKSGKAEFKSSLYKGDIFIFSESVSGNVIFEMDDDQYLEDWDGDDLAFRVNLLGEIQMEGTCSNLKKLVELGDNDINNIKDLERTVNNMNSLIDIAVHYDGTKTRQASIELEAMVDEDYYYGDYYWIEPVIVFEDESRYLFYEYFNEDDFKYLIKKFERLVENYENMLEDFEDILYY